MKITEVKNLLRVGQIVLNETGSGPALHLVVDPKFTRDQLTDEAGRAYYLVVDGEIVKIGASQDKGGIRGTISAYRSGFGGRPSPRTYGICNFMFREVSKGKKVEFYVVFAPVVEVVLPTPTGTKVCTVPVEARYLEDLHVKHFVEKEGRFPVLNLQEQNIRWEDNDLIDEGYFKLINKAAKKR